MQPTNLSTDLPNHAFSAFPDGSQIGSHIDSQGDGSQISEKTSESADTDTDNCTSAVASVVDLHCHTTASDGELTPRELLLLAKSVGIRLLAITDHDTLAGYNELQALITQSSQNTALHLVCGCEFSSAWLGVGVHIVGLNFDANHPRVTDLIHYQQAARASRLAKQLKQLAALQMPMTVEEVSAFAAHQNIGRPHIAQCMVAKGYVDSPAKAFKKYLGRGKLGDMHQYWAPLPQIIDTINQAGGIATIAHPAQYRMTRSKMHRFVRDFVGFGGGAIEVATAGQPADQIEKFALIAKQYGLYASIGSDFHRQRRYHPMLGKIPPLPKDVIPVWHGFNV